VSLGGVAASLGAALTVGWAAVAAAFVAAAVDDPPQRGVGAVLALAVIVLGVLVLAVVTALGARAVWRAESPRRLATGALCSLVIAGWPAMTALGRGLDGISDPVGAAACALTAAAGAILVLLQRARPV
jgi:hypothetical protein